MNEANSEPAGEMNEQDKQSGVAVRLPDRKEEIPDIDKYIDEHGMRDARRYLPKDDDDLDRDVLAGHIRHVVYPDLNALLEAVWKGDAQLDRWFDLDVQIEFVRPDVAGSGETKSFLRLMYTSLQHWRKAQGRRQIAAAVVLSLLGLAAVAILFGMIPPAR